MAATVPILAQTGGGQAGGRETQKEGAALPAGLPACPSTLSPQPPALPTGLPLSVAMQNQATTEIPLHLLIGHSMFLKTTDRLPRVYVGSPEVLQSFIPSPKEVVITA